MPLLNAAKLTTPAVLFLDMNLALRHESRGASRLRARPMYYLAGYYVILIAAWVGAWYLHDLTSIRDLAPRDTVAYWTFAKLIIWIAPILLIVTRALKQSPVVHLGLVRFHHGARAGLAGRRGGASTSGHQPQPLNLPQPPAQLVPTREI